MENQFKTVGQRIFKFHKMSYHQFFQEYNPGKWLLHCHMVEHVEHGMVTAIVYSEQMVSRVNTLKALH